jgi:hypothetical protein
MPIPTGLAIAKAHCREGESLLRDRHEWSTGWTCAAMQDPAARDERILMVIAARFALQPEHLLFLGASLQDLGQAADRARARRDQNLPRSCLGVLSPIAGVLPAFQMIANHPRDVSRQHRCEPVARLS